MVFQKSFPGEGSHLRVTKTDTTPKVFSPKRGLCIWAKWGRFGIFPVLCLLAYGDTALKSYFLLAFEAHTRRGVILTFFVLFFPAFGFLGTPKHYKTRENEKCQIDPVLPPPKRFCWGEGKGESEALRGRGVGFLLKIRGGVLPRRGGAEGPPFRRKRLPSKLGASHCWGDFA